MPRRKPSCGNFTISTVYPEKFGKWLWSELLNSAQWNPTLHTIHGNTLKRYKTKTHEILGLTVTWQPDNKMVFTSDYSIINIRKGLDIDMGNGRIIVSN